jgi:hypothetical protein
MLEIKKKSKITTLSKKFENIAEKQNISHRRHCSNIQQKNKKYHTVGTVPKYSRKTKNITPSELFHNTIVQTIKMFHEEISSLI